MAENRLTLRFTAQNDATKAFKELQSSVTGLQSTVSNVAKGLVALKIGDVFTQGAGAVVGFMSSMQQAKIAFETMTGSVDDTRQHLADLRAFALKTPFEFGDLVEQSKRLQAYGIEVQNVIPTLTTLGNIAAGVGMDKLPQITMAYGQIRAAGKLFGTELRQLTEAGIPIIDALAQHFKVPQGAIREMVEDGKVGFQDVQTALTNLAAEGGKFGGLMEKQSKTFEGAMSNIKDSLLQLGETAFGDVFTKATQGLLDFAASLQTAEAQEWATGVGQAMQALGEVFGAVFGIIGDVLGGFLSMLGVTEEGVGSFINDFRTNMQNMHVTAVQAVTLVKLGFSNMRFAVALFVLEMAEAVEAKFNDIKRMAGNLAVVLSTLVRTAADLPLIGGFATGAADGLQEFAAGLHESANGVTDLQLKIIRLKDEALGEQNKIVAEGSTKLEELAAAQAAAGKAAGDAKPKVDNFSGSVDNLSKKGKEAKKSLDELLASALALDAAMPGIEEMVGAGGLREAAEALVALGESAESAVSKVISIMQRLRSEAESAAKEAADKAAKAAKEAAEAIEEAAKKAADAWRERSNQMARSIIEALKAGKDWAVGTADFFRDEWLAELEARIAEFAQKIRDAMRDGLSIDGIVKDMEPVVKAYQDAQKAITAQAKAAQKAQDELAEAQRHNAEMSQEWIRQLGVQADFEFQERLRAQKKALDDYSKQVDAEIAKIRAWEDSQKSKQAANAAQKLQQAATGAADQRIGALTTMLGEGAAPAWWVNGLRDALHGMVVKSYLDGKDVSKGVSGRQQQGSQLLQMGGFA